MMYDNPSEEAEEAESGGACSSPFQSSPVAALPLRFQLTALPPPPFLSSGSLQKLITSTSSLPTSMSNQGQQPYQAFGEEEEDVFGDEMNFGVQGDYEGTYNEAESGTFSTVPAPSQQPPHHPTRLPTRETGRDFSPSSGGHTASAEQSSRGSSGSRSIISSAFYSATAPAPPQQQQQLPAFPTWPLFEKDAVSSILQELTSTSTHLQSNTLSSSVLLRPPLTRRRPSRPSPRFPSPSRSTSFTSSPSSTLLRLPFPRSRPRTSRCVLDRSIAQWRRMCYRS
jgi:hypothetical protein